MMPNDQQRSFFDVPQFATVPPPRQAPRAADGNTLLAGFLRKRILEELGQARDLGATLQELHERINRPHRELRARLEELKQDGEVVSIEPGDRCPEPHDTVWLLAGWAEEVNV